jgi:hypothetical protein
VTTFIPFTPTIVAGRPPFQFNATFDGLVYTLTVTWSIYGQRWYITIAALDGTLIAYLPMVGSSVPKPLTSLTWKPWNGGLVQAVTAAPHSVPLGWVVEFSVSGASPSEYNAGPARCVITGPSSFVYPLAADPGPATVPGGFSYDVSLVKGYFNSTLVWRIANAQFEVNP